jgi:hypothetical protein
MRSTLLLSGGLLLLLLPSTSSAGPTPSCEVRASRTVERNKSIRVYRAHGVIYGCVQRTGRTVRITDALDCSSSRGCTGEAVVAVAGGYVATVSYGPGSVHVPPQSDGSLTLFDVVRRRLVFIWNTRSAEGAPPYTDGGIRDVALTKGGRVAWIATFQDYSNPSIRPPDFSQVYVKGRTMTVADQGTGIASGSLALAGTRVYWLRDDAPHSAVLPD